MRHATVTPSLRRQRGVAVVELALILPALIMLTFLTTEFGRAIYHYASLTKSVRQAARYLSLQTPGQGVDGAKNLIVYGNLDGTGVPVLPGLSAAQVAAPVWQTVGAAPPLAVVTVRVTGYRFDSFMAGFWGQSWGPFVFSDISATMASMQ